MLFNFFGFKTVGESFLEADVKHIKMVKEIKG